MCTRHIAIALVVFALATVPVAAQATQFVDAEGTYMPDGDFDDDGDIDLFDFAAFQEAFTGP